MTYSFVIIAYNEAENIVGCIHAILAQVALGDAYEIIVVDDGSTDTTRSLVANVAAANPHVRLIGDGKNHGRGYGRFMGVNASSGTYVIMVDADILLPLDWLVRAVPVLEKYEVAGGIAVPDGDVAYVYRRFKLWPKTVMGSTAITGNNGIYRREVFSKLNFDQRLREGEDVDFNNRAARLGVRECTVPQLVVEHNESKSFSRSMAWLYESGKGATRQLHRFRQVRIPDLAFFATVASLVLAIALQLLTGQAWWYMLPLLAIIGASFMHLWGKFEILPKTIFSFTVAVLTNTVLIVCYYLGRLMAYPHAMFGHSGESA